MFARTVAIVFLVSSVTFAAGQNVQVQRIWTSKNNKFQKVATLVDVRAGLAVLKLEDGRQVEVPLDKLCDNDREVAKKFSDDRRAAINEARKKWRAVVIGVDEGDGGRIELPARDSREMLSFGKGSANWPRPVIHAPPGCSAKLSVDDLQGRKGYAINLDGETIATLEQFEDELSFFWAPTATASAEVLRNAALIIGPTTKGKPMPLRARHVVEPMLLDLAEPQMFVPVTIDLNGLDPAKLQLAVDDVAGGAPVKRFDPPNKKAAQGKKVRAILRDKAPFAAIECVLFIKGGVPTVMICPVMSGGKKDTDPWIEKRVNGLAKSLAKKIANAEAMLPQKRQFVRDADDELGRLRRIATTKNHPDAVQAAGHFDNLQHQVNMAIADIKKMEVGQKVWPQQLEAVKIMGELGNEVSKKSLLHYRVYYEVAGREVDVMATR